MTIRDTAKPVNAAPVKNRQSTVPQQYAQRPSFSPGVHVEYHLSYINYTSAPVFVKNQNNETVVVNQTDNKYADDHERDNFVVMMTHDFKSGIGIRLTHDFLSEQAEAGIFLSDSSLALLNTLRNYCRQFAQTATPKPAAFQTRVITMGADLEKADSIYCQQTNLLISQNLEIASTYHINSGMGVHRAEHQRLFGKEFQHGVLVRVVDNEMLHPYRYYYAGKELIRVRSVRDEAIASGVYVTSYNVKKDGFNPERQDCVYSFEEAKVAIGLFPSQEEAMSHGNPEKIMEIEEARLKAEEARLRQKGFESKSVLEEEKSKAALDRIAFEREKAELEAMKERHRLEDEEARRQLEFERERLKLKDEEDRAARKRQDEEERRQLELERERAKVKDEEERVARKRQDEEAQRQLELERERLKLRDEEERALRKLRDEEERAARKRQEEEERRIIELERERAKLKDEEERRRVELEREQLKLKEEAERSFRKQEEELRRMQFEFEQERRKRQDEEERAERKRQLEIEELHRIRELAGIKQKDERRKFKKEKKKTKIEKELAKMKFLLEQKKATTDIVQTERKDYYNSIDYARRDHYDDRAYHRKDSSENAKFYQGMFVAGVTALGTLAAVYSMSKSRQ